MPDGMQNQRRSSKGFTLPEALIAVSVVVVLSAIATIGFQASMKSMRVTTAYDYTLMALRTAHDRAIAERTVFLVQFAAPRTITTTRIRQGVRTQVGSIQLPADIDFQIESGAPTGSTRTPDNFGAGAIAIDFSVNFAGGGTDVYFQPDGSARDNLGRLNNGIVYLARNLELSSSRAVTVFGATGRIKGWRLNNVGGSLIWQ